MERSGTQFLGNEGDGTRVYSNDRCRNLVLVCSTLLSPLQTTTTTTAILRPPGLCPGLPGWAGTRKVKPISIYWSKR